MNAPYALDKGNAKFLGVCAGFARWAEVDPTLTRATLVLITFVLGPLAILVYFLTALVANNG